MVRTLRRALPLTIALGSLVVIGVGLRELFAHRPDNLPPAGGLTFEAAFEALCSSRIPLEAAEDSDTIEGCVFDSQGRPAQSAIVVARVRRRSGWFALVDAERQASELLAGQTRTDERGGFLLRVPPRALRARDRRP